MCDLSIEVFFWYNLYLLLIWYNEFYVYGFFIIVVLYKKNFFLLLGYNFYYNVGFFEYFCYFLLVLNLFYYFGLFLLVK